MAKTKKAPAKRTTTTTTVEEPELDQEHVEELDVFERAKLEFSGPVAAKLTVYRYDDGETSYLKRVAYDPGTIDEEWIRKKFGAGTYQLRFQDPEMPQRVWSKVVSISPEQPPSSSPASAANDSILETLRRQNEIMLQGLLARLATPAPAAAGGGGGGGNEALVELVRGMMTQNAELLRASVNRPDTSQTLLQVLERGMSFAAEAKLDSEGGWVAQLGKIAKDVLPVIQEMARHRPMPSGYPVAGAASTSPGRVNGAPMLGAGGGPGGAGPGGGGPPAGVVDTNPSAPPSSSPSPSSRTPSGPSGPSGGEGLDVEKLIREFSPAILNAIGQGIPPTALADEILRYVPPFYYGEFESLTTERVVQLNQSFGAHRAYIDELVTSLKDTGDDGDGDEAA